MRKNHSGMLLSMLLSLMLTAFTQASAQNRTVTGTVVNNDSGEPVANASVKAKGSAKGSMTDSRGAFSLNVPEGTVLEVSSVGFKSLETAADFANPMQIRVSVTNPTLADVVVVGYGTRKRSDVTGAVSSVDKGRLSQLPVTNTLQAVQGSVAGVNITQGSSVPGSSPKAQVRGANSISASTDPFLVVDGVPFAGSFNDINPADIASIDILKDVSSVAVYGTRGANGVILITTKRGRTGKASISYSGYAGVEDFANIVRPMGPEQYLQRFADWKAQSGSTSTGALPNAFELANLASGTTTDWMDRIRQTGSIMNHTLSVSGGNRDVKYYISGDYLKQRGVIKGYQFQRASLRSNIDATITDYLNVGVNLFLNSNNSDGGRASLTAASQLSPYGTFQRADGNYEVFPMFGELLYTNAMLGLTTERQERTTNMNINTYAELKPAFAKGLRYRVNATYSYLPGVLRRYEGRAAGNLIGLAQVDNNETRNWVVENILTYEKSWGRHRADATALYGAQQTNFFSSTTTGTGFINDILEFNNLSSATNISANSLAYQTNLLSQMLRLNYSYDGRYLFTATARRDGFSAFGSNTNKYGLFPSFAVAWNVSNESFLKNSKSIDNLKVRFSYGLTGNQSVNPGQTQSTFATVRMPYNGLSTIGVIANVLGNDNLTWESTYGSNLGVDFAILDNKVTGSVEFYSTRTRDLLLFRSIPTITGFNKVWDNLGKLANRGIELTLRTQNVNRGDFKWETSLNFSSNRNRIVDLYGDGKDDIGNQWFIGKPLGVIYDYKLTGIWQTGESPAGQDPIAKPGDLKFADINGSKTITAEDRTILGQTAPKWIGGITNTFHYKNLHLNVFFQTVQGVTKNNPLLDFRDLAGRQNLPADLAYWSATNPSNTRPSLVYNNSRLYGYAEDASFTRLKDVTLSYVVPKGVTDRMKIGGATFYASGRNLFTWTKWFGWDPEEDYNRNPGGTAANTNNSYPLVRTFVLGANITLR